MYTVQSLKEELVKKLEKEQDEYLENIRMKGVDYAIDRAYEISARQEIIDCLNVMNIELKDINALIKTDKVLDMFYDEWLDYDGNLYESFEYTVENATKSLSDEFYSKDDKDDKQENKTVKTKNNERESR